MSGAPSRGDSELHLRCFLYYLGGPQNLEAHDPAIIPKVGSDAGAYFVAFANPLVAQRDDEGVGLPIVYDLHLTSA